MNRLIINRRHTRSRIVAAFVMNALHPIMERIERMEVNNGGDAGRLRRDALEAILDVLSATGVEVITDADRAMAGLPPRNEYGMTDEEMRVLEERRIEMMRQPIQAPKL